MASFCMQYAVAQTTLPVIKATSSKVTINDGGYLNKNGWTLSPKIRPDTYTADRTRKTKWVTFYTNIDSVRVKVKPGTRFNFVILLNGKDSCYTQIASAIPPEAETKQLTATHDTIPFTLTTYNAIGVKVVVNSTDTLNFHFDVSSFGFHITQEAILKKTKLLANQPDALAGKAKPNFNKLSRVSKFQMGNLVWYNPEILPTNITAHEMDGRIGWDVFEGKIVEINYNRHLLIVHSKMPKHLKGYHQAPIDFVHSQACIKGTFEVNHKKYNSYFAMDTGSEQAVILNNDWIEKQKYPKNLKLIKSTVLHDPQGKKYETKIVQSPLLKLAGYPLINIPTLMVEGLNRSTSEVNYLGNDLLKRFNIILDFKHDQIYLKPNQLFKMKYRGEA
ncbi:hypothetical protein HH214_14150 [Mucilaginibacter robiniae]|uniref:Aspartyl protease n=1 Tax=Mucilaginibacter robiniae TaxID=2728022 RepID=A0A7L5E1M1_9SPHI|nr:hypothetical protein [Mucilaginibacter robiniae]QJD96931.1 hypothetical protein HH214_14150 [Mucilaginibacter robiniae]